jgi:hypothetical protein
VLLLVLNEVVLVLDFSQGTVLSSRRASTGAAFEQEHEHDKTTPRKAEFSLKSGDFQLANIGNRRPRFETHLPKEFDQE